MRYGIALALCAATLCAASSAYAGDPEADRRIYAAFERHLSRIPEPEQARECEKFLEWYPDNTYAPEVKKKLEKLKVKGIIAKREGSAEVPAPTASGVDPS